MVDRICTIPDCSGKHWSNGWCRAHYSRARRHGGDPFGGRLPGGQIAWLRAEMPKRVVECKIWPFSKTNMGYGQVCENYQMYLVHVLACEEHWGPMPEPGMEAAHGPCHDRACFNGDHLRWATHGQNMADRLRDGTLPTGARLTANAVRLIRAALAVEGATQRSVAEQFEIHPLTVGRIQRRATWAHLPDGTD